MENTGFMERLMNGSLAQEKRKQPDQDFYWYTPVEEPADNPAENPAAVTEVPQSFAENVAARSLTQTLEAPPASAGLTPSQVTPSLVTPQPAAPPQKNESTQNHICYLIQVDRDGDIVRTGVVRSLPASISPLRDVIETLLSGPTAEELQRGLTSLIPRETKLLNVVIRGNTAYINFNEDFQFNTFGVEGYLGQLRQVVWTATEFSAINDVQILIEGRRVDYLGEGIWIGGPVGRDSL
ncbi:MAG: GerMN domain-containing protein [Treponema sp.]|nr:GerMN domain-containing protein [Treponema sp.]